MPKYPPEQLRLMAQEFLAAQAVGDERAFFVVVMLAVNTGLTAEECQARIEMIAMGAV